MATYYRFLLVFAFGLLLSSPLSAQHFVEIRGSFTREGLTQRYVDYSYEFDNGAVVDVSVYNEPGSTEVWAGAGKTFKYKESNHYVGGYLVVGNENQVGLGLVYEGDVEFKKLKLSTSTNAFIPAKGKVPKYLTLENFDITTPIKEKFEVGASFGSFLIHKETNLVGGPVFKYNTKLGTTTFALRGGAYTEFRVSQTFNF